MIKSFFAILGIILFLGIIAGLVADIRSFDRTKGGYDYPYEGWSGEVLDFSAMYQTEEGLYKSGYVIDLFFNCRTGLITWKMFRLFKGEFRKASERAIVVHRPQDECKVRGFDPTSWAKSDLL